MAGVLEWAAKALDQVDQAAKEVLQGRHEKMLKICNTFAFVPPRLSINSQQMRRRGNAFRLARISVLCAAALRESSRSV